MKRRLLRIALLAGGGLLLLILSIALILRHMGGNALQDWIGAQLETVANDYLNPKLSFTDLVYQYPLGVSLKNLHLTADDPAHPGHTIDIIACNRAEISLAEIPSFGKPIVIEKILLDGPLISAVAVEPRSKKFVGFSNLVRGATDQGPKQEDQSTSSPHKLSDIFRMRLVQIKDGKVVYDPRIAGTVPMMLDKINTLLNITPTDEGWYKLDTIIAREPVFKLSVGGQLNLDSFSVRDVDVKLLADLGRDKLDYIPPELQALLKQYGCRGKLNLEISGSMPVTDPLKGEVKASINVDHANLATNGLQIPVDDLDLEAKFADSKMVLSSLKISALGGTADLAGSATLNERLDANLHLKIADMVPERLLAEPSYASAAPVALHLDLTVAGSLKSLVGEAAATPGQPLAAINLKDFQLSASDPLHPNQTIDVAACKNLDIAMTRPILPGGPIVIDRIIFDEPSVSAVAVMPGALQLIGEPNFPTDSKAASVNAPASPAELTSPSPASIKLNDIIQVKTFQLRGAKITYNPRIAGTQAMVLDDINTSLNLDPGGMGIYSIDTEISRGSAFTFGVSGNINLEHPGLQNLGLKIHADLTQPDLGFLPPQLQIIILQTKAHGTLDANAAASISFADASSGSAMLDIKLDHLDLKHGDAHFPLESLSIAAQLQEGKIDQMVRISALKNEFEFDGTTTLNKGLDTDMVLKLQDFQIESLAPFLRPGAPAPTSSTMLNADIEMQTALRSALGGAPPEPGRPVASLIVRDFRLSTTDPLNPTKPLDFVSVGSFDMALASAYLPGKPLAIDHITIEKSAIRAIAVAPYSSEFVGFADLQNLFLNPVASLATQPAVQTPLEGVALATLPAVSASSPPPPRFSQMIRLNTLVVDDLSIDYDPRFERTFPLSLRHIGLKLNMDSDTGESYRFIAAVASKPDLSLNLDGKLNIDSLNLTPINLDLAVDIGTNVPRYLLPQVQAMLKPYDPVASAHLKISGDIPLLQPTQADLNIVILADDVKATAGDYRVPIDHLRLPLEFKAGQVHLLDATPLGGDTLAALGGVANLTGVITLDDDLHTDLVFTIDGMLLQDLKDAQISTPKRDLVGVLHTDLRLMNAPLAVIASQSAEPPTPVPSASPKPPGDMTQDSTDGASPTAGATSETATSDPSDSTIASTSARAPDATQPSTMSDFYATATTQPATAVWGSVDIELTHARLAGLEVIQGISNIAKSVFSNLFTKKDANQQVVPEEKATVLCYMTENRAMFSKIRYEGELLAADGYGYITLDKYADLCLAGGPISKLAGKGSFANWIKTASDSLLYYRVVGPLSNLKYEVKGGDGKPIVQGAESIADKGVNVADKGVKVVGKGLDKASSFIGGLFKHKDPDNGN